jgi:hypothetical protein
MRRSLRTLIIGIILAHLLCGQYAPAEPPLRGILVPRPGEYTFTDHPGIFDDINDRDGITIEAWFYLTDIPSEYKERWILMEKPDSYSIRIRGRVSPPAFPFLDPPGTVYLQHRIMSQEGNAASAAVGDTPLDSPLNRWIHFALQLREEAGGTGEASFLNGMPLSTGRAIEIPEKS